jgi:hypothetical protein
MTTAVAAPAVPQTLGLNKQVKNWVSLRRQRPRVHGYHPSEMAKLCPVLFYFISEAREKLASDNPREVQEGWAFLNRVQEAKTAGFSVNVRMEFRVGDAIHADVQFLLGVLGKLWGRWKCPFCRAKTQHGWMPRVMTVGMGGHEIPDAAPCVRCKGGNLKFDNSWEYIEPWVGSPEWGIEGHTDGDLRPIYDNNPLRMILEIKSINEAGYQGKRGVLPREDHVKQASIYGWLMGVTHICFVYVNKNQVNEWREFIVPVDQAAIADMQNKIHAAEWGRQHGRPPIHARACPDPRERRAKECPAREMCFGEMPTTNNFWE